MAMVQDAFLRSINVQLDVDHPGRFTHFRPTSKSVSLIESVLDPAGDRSLLVVAPYGSGKSLTAGYLLQVIQNEPDRFEEGEKLLERVANRIGEVRPDLAAKLKARVTSRAPGVGVCLHGHGASTTGMIRANLRQGFLRAGMGREARSFAKVEEAGADSVADLIDIATEKLRRAGRDHLLLVWDEFGRHLEAMVADGRPGDLLALQVLAEAASRSQDVTVTVLLLLHRSFMGYASGLPMGARQEWSKIEGRFRVVQYVDDSLEMHRLLASISRDSRPGPPRATKGSSELAERSRSSGILSEFPEQDLTELLRDAWPLEPATLWLLPKVAARVAQHERTSFSFLNDSELSEPVKPADLYDYFRGEFRGDTGPGGTHKAWLEVESALSKVDPSSLDSEILKAAFLLNLGLSGERSRTPRARLEEAVRGTVHGKKEVSRTVDDLIARKLIIHRAHTDQVLVWHGTDVDLRGRLEDERRRLEGSFELVPFLSKEMPPPVWRPTKHNAETGVPRYLASRFVVPGALEGYSDHLELGLREPGTDGEILYVIPDSDEGYDEAVSRAKGISDPRAFVAVGKSPSSLRASALELAALLRMHQDSDLVGQDPMIRPELDHLTDDARQAIRPLLNRIVVPGMGGADWFHAGRPIDFGCPVAFRRHLSAVMDELFEATPRILSEMVVRRRPTPVVINARKKVELGILERYGQEAVGIEGDFADKAIFRSVLLRTGLYRKGGEHWRFANPKEIEDPGLSRVWGEVEQFYSEPGSRSVQVLVHRLLEPPYGVREGVIPLFLAAGLKAFPAPKSIRSKASYISDVLPSVIEDIARSPGDFTVDVLSLSSAEEEYLQCLLTRFGDHAPGADPNDDLLRRVFDAIQAWWVGLPQAAKSSSAISKQARQFRSLISVPEPADVLLERLPKAFGGESKDLERARATVLRAVTELEEIQKGYIAAARSALRSALASRGVTTGGNITKGARTWAAFFPKSLPLKSLSPVARATLMQLRRKHDSEEALLNALALLVAGHAFKDWTDAVVPEFERRLRTALEDIEHAALEAGTASDAPEEIRAGLLELSRARLRLILSQIAELAGQNDTLDLLNKEIAGLLTPHAKDV
jgi:hypothetical protein